MTSLARLHPRDFHLHFLEQQVRPDGRSLSVARPVTVTTNVLRGVDSSVLLCVSGSRVLVSVVLELAPLNTIQNKYAYINYNVNYNQHAHAKYYNKKHKLQEEANRIGQLANQLIMDSGMFDVSRLCVIPGVSALLLNVSVCVLSDDGNVLDAAIIAIVKAINTCKIPHTHMMEDGEVLISSVSSPHRCMHGYVLPFTFGVLDDYMLADTTAEEQELLNAQFTIVLNESCEMIHVYKCGGVPVDEQLLKQALHIAKLRYKSLVPYFL